MDIKKEKPQKKDFSLTLYHKRIRKEIEYEK